MTLKAWPSEYRAIWNAGHHRLSLPLECHRRAERYVYLLVGVLPAQQRIQRNEKTGVDAIEVVISEDFNRADTTRIRRHIGVSLQGINARWIEDDWCAVVRPRRCLSLRGHKQRTLALLN